jgi:hypothetical protein
MTGHRTLNVADSTVVPSARAAQERVCAAPDYFEVPVL